MADGACVGDAKCAEIERDESLARPEDSDG
jgi:hypothetical protein